LSISPSVEGNQQAVSFPVIQALGQIIERIGVICQIKAVISLSFVSLGDKFQVSADNAVVFVLDESIKRSHASQSSKPTHIRRRKLGGSPAMGKGGRD
jgi:hypothetical protein